MQQKVIITCAVTGAGDTVGKSPNVPVTPKQIAHAALEAASAGATVVHCHVRNPETGKGSRSVNLYREVMEIIRAKNTDVIINLTAGMGGDVVVGDGEKPLEFGEGTDCVGPLERLLHIEALHPEIGGGNHIKLMRRGGHQHRVGPAGAGVVAGALGHQPGPAVVDGEQAQAGDEINVVALLDEVDDAVGVNAAADHQISAVVIGPG